LFYAYKPDQRWPLLGLSPSRSSKSILSASAPCREPLIMSVKDILHMFSKTILLVDDTPLFIKIAKDFFRREQVNILTANNGPEAVTIARNEKPDLIFMDLYMIGGDGDEACKEIKNNINLKLTPIIMVTSSNNPKDSARCLSAGCNEIIHKPLKREQFLEISRKYLKFPAWSGKRSQIKTPARFGIDSDKMFHGCLSDISVGGVFLETDRLFPVDTELHLEFQLDQDTEFKKCKGRVAWFNQKGSLKKDYPSTGMGIQFINIQKLDILSIQAWIRNKSQ
jgi:CheY-like chemotaxis protein